MKIYLRNIHLHTTFSTLNLCTSTYSIKDFCILLPQLTVAMEKLTLSKLEQYLGKAAWILKGPVDAADFKIYIFPLLFFKRISDVYDEEYQIALEESGNDADYASLAELHRFIIPKDCH